MDAEAVEALGECGGSEPSVTLALLPYLRPNRSVSPSSVLHALACARADARNHVPEIRKAVQVAGLKWFERVEADKLIASLEQP